MTDSIISPVIKEIYKGCESERAFGTMKEIARYHRIQASRGFREAAKASSDLLKAAGLKTRILSYPAELKNVCFTQRMFRDRKSVV